MTEERAASSPVAVEGLVYTGEPQELITPQPGDWSYSLDGETYTSSLPTGINAGTYTVYMREGDSDPVVITVTIAKADVVNIIAPVAPSPVTRGGEGPADASEEVSSPVTTSEEGSAGEEEPAYAAGDEPDEVVFEQVA